ncbi:MAG: hypothetical protein P4L45_12220, partial [Ignavibacteriaceae bacterium]|nr:hypothetical protein [Ignavibacteriaceae bacterium]
GTNWTQVNNFTHVYFFAVSGTNIFAGTAWNGVFLSTNNGTTWTQVNTGLANTVVTSLVVSGANIFAGIGNNNDLGIGGVYLSTNSGTNWTQTGLTNVGVSSITVSGTNIFAGTVNRGVYFLKNNGTY